MDESANHIAADHSQKPQNDENHKDGPEHMGPFRVIGFSSRLKPILLSTGQKINRGIPVFLTRKYNILKLAITE